MKIFITWNVILITFLLLISVYKKVQIKRVIGAVVVLSLVSWFIFGKGITSYTFNLDVREGTKKYTKEELFIDDWGYLSFKNKDFNRSVHADDIDYILTKNIEEPYFKIDYKIVKNVFVKFLTGGVEEIEQVKLYLPVNDYVRYKTNTPSELLTEEEESEKSEEKK